MKWNQSTVAGKHEGHFVEAHYSPAPCDSDLHTKQHHFNDWDKTAVCSTCIFVYFVLSGFLCRSQTQPHYQLLTWLACFPQSCLPCAFPHTRCSLWNEMHNSCLPWFLSFCGISLDSSPCLGIMLRNEQTLAFSPLSQSCSIFFFQRPLT